MLLRTKLHRPASACCPQSERPRMMRTWSPPRTSVVMSVQVEPSSEMSTWIGSGV
ncbi:hypothetical protein [Streptomyces alboflavus]|uniref:hypothetical protein n=1 Tax=Streptomyces alboflavus TaxID=67267 RepID=UPI0012FF2F06|nr:hypothetical protein [Streptomyces alboflavus]